MLDWFEGSIEARTQATIYNPRDNVAVIAHALTTFHSESVWTDWQTRVLTYSEQGKILGSVYGYHTIAFWSSIDYADEEKLINSGKFSHSQNVRVELAARVPAFQGTWQPVADVWIPVYIIGSDEEPAPVPENPEGVYPAPVPEPTPIITPNPTPTPTPEPFNLPDWVLPVAVAGVALILLLPPKKKGK